MNTNTPRTDALPSTQSMLTAQSDPVQLYQQLCKVTVDFGKALDACVEYREQLATSKAEVKEIRSALGDDGRRTHKEILELATKASQWREWKEKYIDLKNAHIAEGQDPAGTIWEHADKLQKELKEAKAEVESVEKISEARRKSLAFALNEMNKLEAEVEFWKAKAYEAEESEAKLEAEVERLKELLNRAINEIEKTPFNTPKLTAFTAHRLADRYREKMTNTSTKPIESQEDDK